MADDHPRSVLGRGRSGQPTAARGAGLGRGVLETRLKGPSASGIMHAMEEPRADSAIPLVTVIGSLLAGTSGALVAVQVGLWFASSMADGVTGPQTMWVTVLMSTGMLVLGIVMFLTALALLSQRHPATCGRRTSAWATIGFVAMTAWAIGVPLLLRV